MTFNLDLGMGPLTALGSFLVLTCVVIFLYLPIGVRSLHEEGGGAPGTDPGAPVNPMFGRKLMWAAMTSAGLVLLLELLLVTGTLKAPGL
jgi:predicted secreted protein